MVYEPPQKRLLTAEQLTAFQSSETHQAVIGYIETLNEATVGAKLSDQCPQSPVRMTRLPWNRRSTDMDPRLCRLSLWRSFIM